MKLNELQPSEGSRKNPKRIGRGQGSGHGNHTSTRGSKGQNSRSGGGVKPGFEGGQMPLQRRLPKRGFKNPFRSKVVSVNVRDLNRFDAGSVVDAQALAEAGLIKGSFELIKLLGQGEVDRALTIKVDQVSAGAREKVEKAGGSVELN
jgi:large subunit ribosomal protein L15